MSAHSQLILPPKGLASCIVGCIVRDTRSARLSDVDRVNYFPAMPMFSATLVLEGQLHISDAIIPIETLRRRPAAPKKLFQKPQSRPQMSWSPGPIYALTVAFFPDAWLRLGGTLDGIPPEGIERALSVLDCDSLEANWPDFWTEILALKAKRVGKDPADWTGSDRIRDWSYHLAGQLAHTGTGRSLRSAQRRLKRWTGLNMQTLEFFTKIEDLHRLTSQEPTASPSELATDAGFADQSHMGRALKRATGFSPVILNQKIATEESFWCYRLLGERF